MNKNNLYMGLLVLLISLYSITDFFTTGRQDRTAPAGSKTTAFCLARASPDSRASPGDTTRCSIKMEGRSNTIILNGKVLVSTPDTTEKPTNIRVRGEGNTITINQTDHTSEVNVTQKGKNNQIKISQTQK